MSYMCGTDQQLWDLSTPLQQDSKVDLASPSQPYRASPLPLDRCMSSEHTQCTDYYNLAEYNVCQQLLTQRPPKKGWIYVLHELDSQHVKIGRTADAVEKRLVDVKRAHGRPHTVLFSATTARDARYQLTDLERLVHTDLWHFRQIYGCPLPCQTEHREWLAVTPAIAKASVELWLHISERLCDVRGNVKHPWKDRLRERKLPFGYDHGDHRQRIAYWEEMFKEIFAVGELDIDGV